MKNLFVVNPKAGKGKKALKFVQLIENYCRSVGEHYEIYITKAQYDAIDFVKEYLSENSDARVFACGGDGTLYDVVNGSVGFSNVSVGVIPLGSGNDFVRNFSQKENFLNFEKQFSGSEITLDLIKCDGRYAINQCSMGLDAETGAKQAKYKKLPLVSGEFAFAVAAVDSLIKRHENYFRIQVDENEPYSMKLLFCLAANTKYYGGGYLAAPDANAKDGYIDLVTVENPGSRIKLLKLLPKYKKGEHKTWSITKIVRCKKVFVEAAKEAAINVDGECHYGRKTVFEIEKSAIRFIVPKGCVMKE